MPSQANVLFSLFLTQTPVLPGVADGDDLKLASGGIGPLGPYLVIYSLPFGISGAVTLPCVQLLGVDLKAEAGGQPTKKK